MTEHKVLTRREFITRGAGAVAGATLLGGIGRAVLAETKPRKPNIVFVFADQMRNCSLGCMGDKEIHTPNMDRMAKGGLLFTNAISGFPLCAPYRAMLLTGRYPVATGVVTNNVKLPDTEITIAKALKENGYKTGYIGKWHLDGNLQREPQAARQGFNYFIDRRRGELSDLPGVTKSDYLPDEQTDLAIEFLKKHKDETFCLFLSWVPPHPPYVPPKRYRDKYDPKKLKLRPNVQGEEVRDTIAKSYAMITGLDDNIGRLTKALDELGLAEDTIFCFSSDHGDMLGSQGHMNKNLPWEESINIPFIVRYPKKVKAGGKTDVLLNSVDVMPTLLGMCGVPIPKAVQGTDLSGTVPGKGGPKPESAFLMDLIPGPSALSTGVDTWRGVRTQRYTYARLREKPWLLYDNEKDPYQMNNLADKPEAKDLQTKLDAQLQEWLKKTGDKFEPMETWWQRIGRKGTPVGKKETRKALKANERKGQTNANQ